MELKKLNNYFHPNNRSIQELTRLWISETNKVIDRTTKIAFAAFALIAIGITYLIIKAVRDYSVAKTLPRQRENLPKLTPSLPGPAAGHSTSTVPSTISLPSSNQISHAEAPHAGSDGQTSPDQPSQLISSSGSSKENETCIQQKAATGSPLKKEQPIQAKIVNFPAIISPIKFITDENILRDEYKTLPDASASLTGKKRQSIFPIAYRKQRTCRYSHVLAFDPTRVQINSQTDFFYNANWVLNGQAIAAMAPTEKEKNRFWEMIWFSKVTTILMLTPLKEDNKEKCYQYWPDLAKKSAQFPTEELTLLNVHFRKEQVILINSQKITIRTFILIYKDDSRELTQYHFEGWREKGVISEKTLAELVIILKKHLDKTKDEPFLVHGTAGIGRTGTFLATFEAYKQLLEGNRDPKLISNIATDLRGHTTGRDNMIENAGQYKLVHETLNLLQGIGSQ